MPVSIVINKQNMGLQKPKKSAEQRVREQVNYVSYKKLGKHFDVSGDTVILVGITKGSVKPKAKVVAYNDDGQHDAYYYRADESLQADIPKNAENVCEYVGGMRIYTESGLVKTLHGKTEEERITVFRHGDILIIRMGKSINELAKEQKKKDLEKIGVWRA